MLEENCFKLFWKSTRLIGFMVVLFALLLLSACTDYLQDIDDKYDEWLARTGAAEKSSSSNLSYNLSSSSKVTKPTIIYSSSVVSNLNRNFLTDSRDGQTYKTVVIGSQMWMAQNLNYKIENGCKKGNICGSYCYEDADSNCTKYGRLYLWNDAIKVCPIGWHLPSESDWDLLFDAVGGQSSAGKILMSKSGWSYSIGTDVYGFSALPAGYRGNSGGYAYEDYQACFWSSVEKSSDYAFIMWLERGEYDAFWSSVLKYTWRSVRCVKD